MNEVIRFFNDIITLGLEKVGLFYSSYRGYVVDVDDPKKLGRIKITVPEIHGDNNFNYWAWPKGMFSGKGYGARVLPKKDDLVWVEFEKGNPRKPIWNFAYFGKDELPEDLLDPKYIWFRTPNGMTLAIDEVAKTISLYEKGKELEPMLLGNKTFEKVDKLFDLLIKVKVNTMIGPQPFMNVQDFIDLRQELDEIRSETNLIS